MRSNIFVLTTNNNNTFSIILLIFSDEISKGNIFMKVLKTILIIIYPILVILLLLPNLKSCNESRTNDLGDKIEEPINTAEVVKHAEMIGQSGILKVTLLWNFQGDIDLHVKQPNGKEIYYNEKEDANTGGFLDVDNVNGGNGSAENIYWKNPPKGDYDVSLVYYQASCLTNLANKGTCSVVIFQQGKSPQTYTVPMKSIKEEIKVTTIKIQ